MDPKQLFRDGDLAAAIAAQTERVKARPGDTESRTFLFELLSFAGELDRAERQLDVVAHQDAQAEAAAQVYRNLLHAERVRRRVFSDGHKPEFLVDATPSYVGLHLEAIQHLREGNPTQARSSLDEAESRRPKLRGSIDGQLFDDFRDCDDLVAPFLELFVLREYVWLPFEEIGELEVPLPERPRDLIWTPVKIVLKDGRSRRGYVPALYHGSHQHQDDRIRLGRMTDWTGPDGGPTVGCGQRLLLAGDEGRPLLEMRRLVFESA